MKSDVINIDEVVEHSPLSAFQFGLLLLCSLCLIIDGFDVQAMGYVAPAIIADWHANKASLGPVFGAGLLGLLIGSLVLTPVSDKYGRRPVLIFATFFFATCMLLTTQVQTINQLMILRFITGFGLGSIMPNALALVCEWSPGRVHVTRMMVVSCGFTVGAAIGGFVSAALIPTFGWRAVFLVGGLVPMGLGLAMLFWLPESIQFLVLHKRPLKQVERWLRKIIPGICLTQETIVIVKEAADERMPVIELFRHGRTRVTLLLWLVTFMNLINLYFLANWLPTLIKDDGYSTVMAVLIGTALQVGGIIGTLSLSWFINRRGFTKTLGACFVIACIFIVLIGYVSASLYLLFLCVLVVGFCVVGSQPAVNALAGTFYPTTLRSTGIGWALGIGRIGSFMGPVVGGQLIALQWSNSSLFITAAIPALISALMIGVLHYTTKTSQPEINSVIH